MSGELISKYQVLSQFMLNNSINFNKREISLNNVALLWLLSYTRLISIVSKIIFGRKNFPNKICLVKKIDEQKKQFQPQKMWGQEI